MDNTGVLQNGIISSHGISISPAVVFKITWVNQTLPDITFGLYDHFRKSDADCIKNFPDELVNFSFYNSRSRIIFVCMVYRWMPNAM